MKKGTNLLKSIHVRQRLAHGGVDHVEVVELTECSEHIGSMEGKQPAGQSKKHDALELCTATK